jgi:hypothetical protein
MGTRVDKVIVAFRIDDGVKIEVGSSRKVVLEVIGVSERKLGLAVSKGDLDEGVVVKSDSGVLWTVRRVEFRRSLRKDRSKRGFSGDW